MYTMNSNLWNALPEDLHLNEHMLTYLKCVLIKIHYFKLPFNVYIIIVLYTFHSSHHSIYYYYFIYTIILAYYFN